MLDKHDIHGICAALVAANGLDMSLTVEHDSVLNLKFSTDAHGNARAVILGAAGMQHARRDGINPAEFVHALVTGHNLSGHLQMNPQTSQIADLINRKKLPLETAVRMLSESISKTEAQEMVRMCALSTAKSFQITE